MHERPSTRGATALSGVTVDLQAVTWLGRATRLRVPIPGPQERDYYVGEGGDVESRVKPAVEAVASGRYSVPMIQTGELSLAQFAADLTTSSSDGPAADLRDPRGSSR